MSFPFLSKPDGAPNVEDRDEAFLLFFFLDDTGFGAAHFTAGAGGGRALAASCAFLFVDVAAVLLLDDMLLTRLGGLWAHSREVATRRHNEMLLLEKLVVVTTPLVCSLQAGDAAAFNDERTSQPLCFVGRLRFEIPAFTS